MTINSIRNVLYKVAKILGDINAINKGKITERVVRRAAGRTSGRLLQRLFRNIFK
ncbi:MAG: hypothetical protein Fur0015_14290 [Ignavibacteriales bacterium]